MKNKNLTAVNWLAEKYNYVTWMRNRDEISARTADEWRRYYFEQAKQMEKLQMFEYIKKHYVIGENSLKFHQEQFEQYYTETFKSE